MFCMYCGNKTEETYNVCPSCGALLKSQEGTTNQPTIPMNTQNTNTASVTGKEIAAVIMSGYALYLAIFGIIAYETVIEFSFVDMEEAGIAVFIFNTVIIQVILAIVALCFAVIARKIQKRGINLASLIMGISALLLTVVEALILLNHYNSL